MKRFSDIGLYLMHKIANGEPLSEDDIMAYTNGDLLRLNALNNLINNFENELIYCKKNEKTISQRTIARWCHCGKEQISDIEKRAIKKSLKSME